MPKKGLPVAVSRSVKGKAVEGQNAKKSLPVAVRKGKTVKGQNAKKSLPATGSRRGKEKAVEGRDSSPEKKRAARPSFGKPYPLRKRLFVELSDSPSSQTSPVSKRACTTPLRPVDQDSDCVVTQVEPFQDIVMNPPDREWKEDTMRYVEQFTGTSLEYKEEYTVIKAEIDSIAPHQVCDIRGDGRCFFRAISKAVTGTQEFHGEFRKAVIEWMLREDHPPQLAVYVDPDSGTDGKAAIKKYVEQTDMAVDGWSGDKEMRAFATMFQIEICVSNNSPGGRRWNYYSPLFYHEHTCREKSDYKLYLYHSGSDTRSHYDLVIPSKE